MRSTKKRNPTSRRRREAMRRAAALALTGVMLFPAGLADLPVYAADGERILYFNNGLAAYDHVFYQTDGGTYKEMVKTADGLYATKEEIGTDQTIRFKGVKSGTVYDTVSNYQVDSESREWGYDYENFIWESEDVDTDGIWDCYFAPALAMQNKYNGTKKLADGSTVTEDFIKNVSYARLDQLPEIRTDLDLDGLIEKTDPVTDGIGTVYAILSGSKTDGGIGNAKITVTPKRACTILAAGSGILLTDPNGYGMRVKESADSTGPADSVSAWYLEGGQTYTLSADTLTGISASAASYEDELSKFSFGRLPQGETEEPVKINNTYSILAASGKSVLIKSTEVDLKGSGNSLSRSIQVTAKEAGNLYVKSNAKTKGRTLKFFTVDAAGKETILEESGENEHTFTIPEAGTYYVASKSSGIIVQALSITYLDDSLTASGRISPENAKNRTFWGYQYKMDGYCGRKEDANDPIPARVPDSVKEVDTSGRKIYEASADLYDYYSDWELSGNDLDSHTDVYGADETGEALRTSDGHGAVTFAEGTNTVSYTYQGSILNRAIADYYDNENAYALYFGSNSWFTGAGRYENGNDTLSFSYEDGAYEAALKKEDTGKDGLYAYRVPNERAYVTSLLPDPAFFSNTAHGMSFSRAVGGLAIQNAGGLSLPGSQKPAPYFNEAFLAGDNSLRARLAKIYKDVSFGFLKNEATGYYEFDSTMPEYAVRLAEKADGYYMAYTGDGVQKADDGSSTKYQFYPFNSSDANDAFYKEDLMFGMKLSIPLTTYLNPDYRTGIFKFSGDDDVWAYIKNDTTDTESLALDIGGTHGAIGGVLDMRTGYAVTESVYREGLGITSGDASGSAMKEKISDLERAAFAIATRDGVFTSRSSDENFIAIRPSSFFDASYSGSGRVRMTIHTEDGDPYYKVTLKGPVYNDSTGELLLAEGSTKTVCFALRDVSDTLTMSAGGEGGIEAGTAPLTLTLYYMERGLNSSNLRLAFKFADGADRTITKEWADGADAHASETVESALYQEAVTDAEEVLGQELSYDQIYVTAETLGRDGMARQTSITGPDGTGEAKFVLNADTKYAAVSVNGIRLTEETYGELHETIGLTLQEDNIPVTPKFSDDLLLVDPQKTLAVRFTAKTGVLSGTDHRQSDADTADTYTIAKANGYLINLVPLTDADIGRTTYVSFVSCGNETIPDPIRYVIVENVSNAYNADTTEHLYYVAAIRQGDRVSFSTDVTGKASDRPLYVKKDVWDPKTLSADTLSKDNYEDAFAGNYGVVESGDKNPYTARLLDYDADAGDLFLSVVTNDPKHDPFTGTANKVLLPVSFTHDTLNVTWTTRKIADIVLSADTGFSRTFKGLANTITVNGHTFPCYYYITPEEVGGAATAYEASYGQAGAAALPVTKETKEGELTLYPFNDSLSIRIFNLPLVNVTVKKTWYPNLPEGGEADITLYRRSGTNDKEEVASFTMRENDVIDPKTGGRIAVNGDGSYTVSYKETAGTILSYTLAGLPACMEDGTRYDYFAEETAWRADGLSDGEYYDTVYQGSAVDAYAWDVPVENRYHVYTDYRLHLKKTDAGTKNAVEGAVFTLYELDEDGSVAKTLGEAVSGTDGTAILPDILEAEHTYRLVETSPAAGYVTPKASITFSLSKGAKRLVFEKDSLTADAEGLLVDASYDTEARILSVTLKNDPTRIAITKTDYKTDAPVAGATLEVINDKGETVYTFETGAEPEYIWRIPAGTYTLREKITPLGYLPAPDQTIEIKDTAELQKFVMDDVPASKIPATGGAGSLPWLYVGIGILGLAVLRKTADTISSADCRQ